MNIPLTPLRFLRYAEQQYAGRTAVVCNQDRFTYAEFADRARRLAEGGPDADRLRAAVRDTVGGEPPKKGGILKALLASPLVGSELDLTRPREQGRKVDI